MKGNTEEQDKVKMKMSLTIFISSTLQFKLAIWACMKTDRLKYWGPDK